MLILKNISCVNMFIGASGWLQHDHGLSLRFNKVDMSTFLSRDAIISLCWLGQGISYLFLSLEWDIALMTNHQITLTLNTFSTVKHKNIQFIQYIQIRWGYHQKYPTCVTPIGIFIIIEGRVICNYWLIFSYKPSFCRKVKTEYCMKKIT